MRCVFCKRTPQQVTWFIVGPKPNELLGICEDCLSICLSILKEAGWQAAESPMERYVRLAPLAARKWAKATAGRAVRP